MGVMKQIATYLYLRKKDPESPNTPWIRYMHGINRLSLLLFLFAIVVMIVKMLIKK
jgi:hypothetical protein